jgi:hypothetical protein
LAWSNVPGTFDTSIDPDQASMFAFEQSVAGEAQILSSVDAGMARQIPVAGRNRWNARFGQL